MREISFLLILGLLIMPLASLPLVSSDDSDYYVKIYDGKLSVGDRLLVNNYTIELTKSITEELYIIVYRGDEIKTVKKALFGIEIEIEELKVIIGKTDETARVILMWKPKLLAEITPRVNRTVTVNGINIKILNTQPLELSIDGEAYTVTKNLTYENLIITYTDEELRIYSLPKVKKSPTLEYDVYYPFNAVVASRKVSIPVEIESRSSTELVLPLKILSDWNAKFLYSNVEVLSVTLKPGEKLSVNLVVENPKEGTLRFMVGKKLCEISFFTKREFQVELPILSMESEAGKNITLPLRIDGAGRVDFNVIEKPENWSVHFLLNGYAVRSFSIDGSKDLTILVSIPRNAELGEHKIKFSINQQIYNFSVVVYKTYKGMPAKLKISIVDEESNPVKKAKITIGNITVYTDAYGIAELEIKPGEYTIIAEKKFHKTVKRKITLEDGEEKSITLKLEKLPYAFTIETRDIISMNIGKEIVPITIKNLGKEDDTYSLYAKAPEGWNVEFYLDQQGLNPIESIDVKAGESKTVYLAVVSPYTAQPGEYEATLQIKGSADEVEKTIKVKLVGEYRLEIYPNPPMISIKAGKEGSAYLRIRNLGNTPITNIKFEASAPEGWEVRFYPEVVPELRSEIFEKGGVRVVGEALTQVRVVVKAPKTTPAGSYQITITAKSDQTKATSQITVRVSQSSKSAYIGILILILTFGAVFWMIRRVGRR